MTTETKLRGIISRMIREEMNKKRDLNEMPNIKDFRSGMFKSQSAKDNVAQLRSGRNTITLDDGSEYKLKSKIKSIDLKKGDVFLGSYNALNQGADVYEFIGVTDNTTKYGKQFKDTGRCAYNSVKDALLKNNVKSLSELDALNDDKEYGYGFYMCVKDLNDKTAGPWFYIYKDSWVRGSGAERLTFTLLDKV